MARYAGIRRKYTRGGGNNDQSVTTKDVVVEANRAKEEAKYESQSTTVITAEDIAKKQGKSVEDVVFNETGVTRTVDAMGRVGIAIRGADPRHTLIMVDGQPVLGDVSKYQGNGDELLRIGAENIDRIELVRGAASAKYGADAIGGVVNIITKKSGKEPSFVFNAETSYHTSRYTSENESSALPSTFFLRGDSGQIGKFNVSAWTSKRSIVPVYASDREYKKGVNWYSDFKPSLRFYGDEKNTGVRGEYAFNDDHKISFNISSDREDVERRNKSLYTGYAWDAFEPMQIFKRNMKRDTYNFTYNGRSGKTDWQFDVSHGKTRENDVTLLTYYNGGHDQYSGKNELAGVDWLEHERTNYNIGLNTAVNDQHLLSYGFGYTTEKAKGSRLKQAPKTYTQTIDPWDYDKSLSVKDNTAGSGDTPTSYVHNYKFETDKNGNLYWDKDGEYYEKGKPPVSYQEAVGGTGTTGWGNTDVYVPAAGAVMSLSDIYHAVGNSTYKTLLKDSLDKGYVTQEDYDKYITMGDTIGDKYEAFRAALQKENPNVDFKSRDEVLAYFNALGKDASGNPFVDYKDVKYNDSYYGEGFEKRDNQLLIGEAELKKTYAYIADTWQLNDDTLVVPSLRLDHSDLFGSKVTGNIGLTHNLNGNAHRRLKANIGTGYSEPGLGEMYYNWEMYGGTSDNHLGWYWIGNPNLKPETSLNFDVSLEGESNNNKTFTKVALFHNEIKNYMTAYFTGQLINLTQNGQYPVTSDRIYSFRNLGKAKITGIEAEVQHKLNDHWSAKLGYTWLHAENASDSDMPSRLLDRPTHKFDIGLNYENKNSGFRGAFWGSYYMNMLDSNSVSIDDTFVGGDGPVSSRKKADYKEKSFGIWNILLEKDLSKDFTVYAGVDNVFNHRDDDRAYQDRLYRFGVNMKLSDLGDALFGDNKPVFKKDKDGNTIITNVYGNSWFLSRPSDNAAKAGTVDVYGDYRLRSNMFKGDNNAAMRETKTTQANTDAAKNYADKSGHGLEQRLRLGVNYQIDDDVNLDVVGSTSRHDTSYNVADKRGLHDVYLEKAELNKKDNQWDWTVGRIHEPMGVTGYWFGKEYDGARVMYTNDKTQVIVGYGDFSQTTGVSDSAYNHKEQTIIHRAPTLSELIGVYRDPDNNGKISKYPDVKFDPDAQADYVDKFNHAGQIQNADGTWTRDPKLTDAEVAEKKLAVMRELVGIMNNVDSAVASSVTWQDAFDNEAKKAYGSSFKTDIKIDGQSVNTVSNLDYEKYGGLTGLLDSKNIKQMISDWLDSSYGNATSYSWTDANNQAVTTTDKNEAIDHLLLTFAGSQSTPKLTDVGISRFFAKIVSAQVNWNPLNNAPVPLPGAPTSLSQVGYLLSQDKIPAMDRAAFVKVRHQIGDNVGLEAWKLNSFGEGAHISRSDVGINEDMRIADVIGIGAKVRLGSKSMLSFDYGQNRSAMGKYFHGSNIYGTDDKKYDLLGFANGSTPDFWVARLDIGIADTNAPGSWNAYLDYKAFDHGSFLGGTGADLPDRYLDGIRSFTAGFGYVPARNLLLEASYTFDAHSTQKRDTLYTPEEFSLGDYTRVSLTYKF